MGRISYGAVIISDLSGKLDTDLFGACDLLYNYSEKVSESIRRIIDESDNVVT